MTHTIPRLVPLLFCNSSKKFAAQTSFGKPDSRQSAKFFKADYIFIRTVADSKPLPRITFVETRSGAVVISFMCERKGVYEDMTRGFSGQFQSHMFLNPEILQCDQKMGT